MTGTTTNTEVQGEVPDILGMSDEDFLKHESVETIKPEPVESKTQEELDAEAATAKKAEEEAAAAEAERLAAEEAAKKEKEVKEPDNASTTKVVEKDDKVQPNSEVKTEKDKTKVPPTGSTDPNKAKDPAGEKTEVDKSVPVDYEKLFKQVMAPFKANGKMIEPRSPEEVIGLMQMGANYTRKMQELQPYRKTMMMLENNGILNEKDISFLIDLKNKNPEAIKKLLKESGLNPMEIDIETDPKYVEGNHLVSDEEERFRSVLDDVVSTDEGKATMGVIHKDWDQASKEHLWKEPDLMKSIHTQRQNGIYDQIVREIEHLKAVGEIPAGTPFLSAYKGVGEWLQKQGKLAPVSGSTQVDPAATTTETRKEPLETRVVPKTATKTDNGELAAAAATTRSGAKKADVFTNPLAMSDEEFMKTMAGRV